MTLAPWVGLGLLLAVTGVAWLLLWLILRADWLQAENARKGLHLTTGLGGLALPWLFDKAWPVLVLAAVTFVALLAVKVSHLLRGTVGSVLHGVTRRSLGEFYLPLSIFVLYFWTGDEPVLYAIPLLIVTFADSMAALIGLAYGSHRYAAEEGFKSTEGSVGFFVVAFFSVHVPLLLFTDTGRAESLVLALILGFLTMLFEALAWRGLDNLLIPLFGYLLLRTLLPMAIDELLVHLAVVCALGLLVLGYRRRTTLTGSALAGAVVVGYLSWTLADWRWAVPPLLVFVSYTWLPPRTELDRRRTHRLEAVLSVCSAGLVWLLLARALERPELYYPFAVSFACHLAIIGVVRLRYAHPELSGAVILPTTSFQGGGMILGPWIIFEGLSVPHGWLLAVGLACVVLAAGGYLATAPDSNLPDVHAQRWKREAAWAAAASGVAAAVQWSGWSP